MANIDATVSEFDPRHHARSIRSAQRPRPAVERDEHVVARNRGPSIRASASLAARAGRQQALGARPDPLVRIVADSRDGVVARLALVTSTSISAAACPSASATFGRRGRLRRCEHHSQRQVKHEERRRSDDKREQTTFHDRSQGRGKRDKILWLRDVFCPPAAHLGKVE